MKSEVSTFLATKFKDKKVVIVGLGREGLSTYRLLHQALPELAITLVDDRPLVELSPVWKTLTTENPALIFRMTSDWLTTESDHSLIFLTPGLPLHHPIRASLEHQSQRLISNTQLFLELLQAVWPNLKTIGVTGTKGKSTTTSVLHHLLKTAGLTSWVGGNLGKPPLDLVAEIEATTDITSPAYVVLELSAHQLDLCQLSPQIAVIQNVAPEHLDYYQTFERYFAAKTHLTQHQQAGDLVIYNPTWEAAAAIAAVSPGEKATFITSAVAEVDASTLAQVRNQQLEMRTSASNEWQTVMSTDQVPLPGSHNLENVLPSVVLAAKLQLSPTLVSQALSSFVGLENRLEKVTELNGVTYYNDSLATVQEATIAALHSFAEQKVILLAGGFDRGQPLKRLAEAILAQKVKLLILFPTTGKRLLTELQTLTANNLPFEIKKVESMAEAVKAAAENSSPGEVVLLSPAAASFNSFKDYQDRADQFKAAILELASQD